MKKGFTLIEVLGVIILLSVIIVIIMPNIINSIKKANKQGDIYTASIIYDAVEKYMYDTNIFEEKNGNTYCVEISELTHNGYIESPIRYNDNDNIEDTMSVKLTYNKKWSYSIVNNNQCTTNVEYICERVEYPDAGFTPEGNYELGDEYSCHVNDYLEFLFVILSVNGNKVSLLYVGSLDNGDYAKWYTSANNTVGPVSAYTYIANETSTWTNIPPITNFNFIDTVDTCSTCGYNNIYTRRVLNDFITHITRDAGSEETYTNLRARLPMYSELKNAGCTDTSESCPAWVGTEYFLNDSVPNSNSNVYYIADTGNFTSVPANTDRYVSVVIELYKFNLE